jgi:hypothetical protein
MILFQDEVCPGRADGTMPFSRQTSTAKMMITSSVLRSHEIFRSLFMSTLLTQKGSFGVCLFDQPKHAFGFGCENGFGR